MSNKLSQAIAFLMFVGVIIFMLANIVIDAQDDADSYVSDEVVKFVDECRTTGKIDADEYAAFARKIYKLGDYKIKIEHSGKRAYADAGETRVDYYSRYTDEILAYMYPDTGEDKNYPLNKDDRITINVEKNGGGMASAFIRMVTLRGDEGTVISNYGGIVGHSGK